MFDVYLNLLLCLKEKQNASDSTQQNINQELKRIAKKLKKEFGHDDEFVFDTAMCYYVSGYYVQAQGLAKNAEIKNIHVIQKWIFKFLAKDFKGLSEEIYEVGKNAKYQDTTIQSEIDTNGLSTSDAVERIVIAKIAEGLLSVISFIETGDDIRISRAKQVFSLCQKLLFSAGEWKLWWWIECLKIITDEFVENSLWHLLKPMQDNAFSIETVEKYIVANYKSETIVELWRTQVESLPKINDAERCSFCISVPTSAGKTKVGELAVLRFLLDYQDQLDTKCVYIAPLKKLCMEVEETFRNAFSEIQPGLVSTFYGYQEVDVFDDYAVRTARILIVTPEKLDGMLRQYPDLASQIKLVIADEGHIIGETNIRGYKYRFLLERLIYILDKKSLSETVKPRIILVSGVLPHMEEFADLISGSQQNIVNINWRPVEEPRIGSWIWNGKEFLSTDAQLPAPLPFQSNNCQEENKFEEQVVLTAIQCAKTSPTMVFSASKRVLQGIKFLEFLQCIANSNPVLFPIRESLPSDLQKYPLHYALLEKGIAIHHGDVPAKVKREVEKRINNGDVRLIFASPTLAQGVNIPFDTILAYRLHHNYYPQYIPITDAVFWNVVGRVGRPISQKKRTASNLDSPRLLFLLNNAPSATNDDRNDYRISFEIQKNGGKYRVASPFLKFLSAIKEKTSLSSHDIIIELAEKKNLQDIVGTLAFDKLGEMTLEQYLKMLDSQLYDLLHESFSDIEITSDWLQNSAKILVDLFVKASDIKPGDLQYIKEAVIARLTFIAKNTSATKRQQDYLLGLPHGDCEKIKSHMEELSSWYHGCIELFSSDQNLGMNNLVNLIDFVSDLSICERKKKKPQQAKTLDQASASKRSDRKISAKIKLFQNWLNGISDSEIEKNLRAFSTIEFSKYKETILDRIPWGISAIGRYLSAIAKESGFSLSQDLEYLPSLVKYGVNSKVACHLVRLGVSRTDAVKIGDAYREKMKKTEIENEGIYTIETDFYESIKSLNIFTDEELRNLGTSEEMIIRAAKIREKYKRETIGMKPEFPPFDLFEIAE